MSKNEENSEGIERGTDKLTHSQVGSLTRRSLVKIAGTAGAAGLLVGQSSAAVSEDDAEEFKLLEATVAEIRAAILTGDLTAEELTRQYIRRIDAYDDELSSVITVNDQAVDRAQELDETLEKSGPVGPLHGVPIGLKDIVNTGDLPTSAGNVLFEDSVPPNDAFITQNIRDAGAIVVAKLNAGEFASGSLSSLGGQTRNPYDTDRDPSGSSTGSGAATAANLVAISVGTETSGSILSPSTDNSIVGLNPTTGLISRDGIVPLSSTLDTSGPMTRTVSDAARLLDVMAGYDSADPVTAEGLDEIPDESYTSFLDVDGLEGVRLGVPRELIQDDPEETGIDVGQPLQVAELFDAAVEDLEAAGATIVDPIEISDELKELVDIAGPIIIGEFKRELNEYIDSLGEDAPVDSMQEILDSDTIEGSILGLFEAAVKVDVSELDENLEYLNALSDQQRLREGLYALFAEDDLDALIYPTNNRTPELIEGDRDPPDDISPSARTFSPAGNFPSITVPAGYTSDPALPVGLSFLSRPFEESSLIELAYAYEQSTMLRQPPEGFGPLDN